jgi:hypothetical protein
MEVAHGLVTVGDIKIAPLTALLRNFIFNFSGLFQIENGHPYVVHV